VTYVPSCSPGVLARHLSVVLLAAATAACSKKPPATFAPDPGLLSRIRAIEISTPATGVCPGQHISTSYVAVLDDGGRVPFARTYDKKRPPQLHVIFLERWSDHAAPLESGDWSAAANPLLSVSTGFRLQVSMKGKPDARGSKVLRPTYECSPHVFNFAGATGAEGRAGSDGPDVVVRLGVVRSPFYDRLIVMGFEVGGAAPYYVFGDATAIPPRDWLVIEARGGQGGRGVKGENGLKGRAGQAGCPGARGGQGGRGGDGGDGGPGGRGGRVTIIAPTEDPFLSGIVEVRVPGGEGGPGGPGGDGGEGGPGGAAVQSSGPQCRPGATGPAGDKGSVGATGPNGRYGTRTAQVITVPLAQVFGTNMPPQLADLLRSPRERQ